MNTKLGISTTLIRSTFFFLISYGMLYFAYKHYTPLIGGGINNDFFQYYNMYLHPLNFDVAESPFIYRQFSAIITFMIIKSGIFYNTGIALNDPLIDQHVFFGALLSNYFALFFTAFIVSRIVDIEIKKVTTLAPLIAGTLCYMSFGTLSYVLSGIVEGWTWFLIALGFYAFRSQNLFLFTIVALIGIFQKEVVDIVLGSISFFFVLISYIKNNYYEKKYLYMFLLSVVSFLAYIVVRKILIPVSGYESQLDLVSLIATITTSDYFSLKYLIPNLISQNLLYLYLFFILMLTINYKIKKISDLYSALKIEYVLSILFTFLILFLIGMATGLGVNIGRVTLVLSPIFSVYIAYYMHILEKFETTN